MASAEGQSRSGHAYQHSEFGLEHVFARVLENLVTRIIGRASKIVVVCRCNYRLCGVAKAQKT